ncbi:TolC family outer membrane protein [Pseudorhodobacter sp. MZDSW-24AT]|uniref:TolC family outer membrane protein n=1 Tax=Pseudorhodobacter sp. MZDSW-24AT TaxID=2052957 RepID=UPI000C1EF568|nr:TolC family outer membrane protein [Pseudorhodobacter sp. MZDSW-24AT]PJF08180.1 transporter [Pseudorhodobacter sp. MZDSW-24AT]
MRGFFAAAAVAVSVMAAPAAQAQTLTDAFIAAYRTSNLLDKQEATLRAADEDVAQAMSTLRPVVDFALNSGYSRSQQTASGPFVEGVRTTFDLSAQLVLLDFGRRAIRIEIAKETVLATRELLRSVEQDVLFAAVASYVEVQVNQQLLALRESNVRLVTQELRAAQDRFEVGEITRTDVSIAEARLAAARAGLAAAEGNLMVAREAFKAATGAYPRGLARLPTSPSLPASMEAARAVALRTHPAILGAQRRVTINELAVELQKAGFKPTVSARAGVGINDVGAENQSFGLSLSQRVYSGGAQASLLRQAIAQRDGARSDLAQAGVQIAEAVGNAWAGLSIANAQVQAGDRQIRAAQTAFDGVREEANLGARTTLDVLNAEQELLDARVTRIEAEAQRYLGVYRVLQAMGLLSVEHLKLGIPTYDPAAYYNAVKNAPSHSAQGKKLDRILEKLK